MGGTVAVLCDMVEEGWPSMDYVADATVESLGQARSGAFTAVRVRPPMTRRLSRTALNGRGYTIDRLLNRFWDYPRAARRLAGTAAICHVVDHSYSQIVHALPARRTVVTCHDVDTFRCLTEPAAEPRSRAFRAMTGRILSGLRRAAVVCCDSSATQDDLVRHGLVPAAQTRVVPLPVHPAFTPTPDPAADREAAGILGTDLSVIDLLNVGSTIPRKRIDRLLRVVARLRQIEPRVRLVRVGGAFTPEQQRLVTELDLGDHVRVLPSLDRRVLAAVYRRAALVLLTSDREGFGLPLVEALACGTPVLASELPVLREVGADAATLVAPDDEVGWTTAARALLARRANADPAWQACRERGLARAAAMSQREYGRRLVEVYEHVLAASGARA